MIGRTYINEEVRENYREPEYNRYADIEQTAVPKGGLRIYLSEQGKMLEEFSNLLSELEIQLQPITTNYPMVAGNKIKDDPSNNSELLNVVMAHNSAIKALMSRVITICHNTQL